MGIMEFSFATGLGFGGEVEVFGLEGTAMMVPMRTEYTISHDSQVNHTSKHALSKNAFENFSIGLESNYSRPFDQERKYATNFWDGDDGKWESKFGLNYGSANSGYNSVQGMEDVKIGTGLGVYFVFGFEVELSFNVTNFFLITSELEMQDE